MRPLFAILAALVLAQCALGAERRFNVGADPRAYVVIGVAESSSQTDPRYTMLWRRLDADGAFTEYEGDNFFEARTHARGSVRVRGIPGEFEMFAVEPGVYALDSVFAVIRDNNVDYFANGVIVGPERPAFEVRAGEAVYLGIWQMDLNETTAVTRLWRLQESDARAVMREAETVVGGVRLRETHTRAVPCSPRPLTRVSRRQGC